MAPELCTGASRNYVSGVTQGRNLVARTMRPTNRPMAVSGSHKKMPHQNSISATGARVALRLTLATRATTIAMTGSATAIATEAVSHQRKNLTTSLCARKEIRARLRQHPLARGEASWEHRKESFPSLSIHAPFVGHDCTQKDGTRG
jgi:hypothetical protein